MRITGQPYEPRGREFESCQPRHNLGPSIMEGPTHFLIENEFLSINVGGKFHQEANISPPPNRLYSRKAAGLLTRFCGKRLYLPQATRAILVI